MAQISKQELKNKFKTGMYPSEQDFSNVFDSYVHKDDMVNINKIEQDIEGISVSLPEMLNTAKNEAVNIANVYTDEGLASKVDIVTGKGLSSNDYTDEEKAKLAAIEITTQVQSDWEQTDNTAVDFIKNKPQVLRQVTDIDNYSGVLGEIIQYVGDNSEQFNPGDNLQLRERNENVPFIELGEMCVPYYNLRKSLAKDRDIYYPNATGVFKISNTIRCWRAGYYFKILNATEDGYTPTIGDKLYCYYPGGNVDVQEATITDIDTEELLFYTDIYNFAQSYSTDVIRIDPTLEDIDGNCYFQYLGIDYSEQVLQGDNNLTLINLATLQIDNTLSYKIVPATSAINKEVTYREWQKLNNIPNSPTEDGSYILTCTVTDGVAEYSWELQQ